jgi:formylglycine-generating enzyme required for sulfatase activity
MTLRLIGAIAILMAVVPARAQMPDRVAVGRLFEMDRTEVTIERFLAFARSTRRWRI